eukprot:gene32769-33832_t
MNSDQVRVIAILIAAVILAGLVWYYYVHHLKSTDDGKSAQQYPVEGTTTKEMFEQHDDGSVTRISPSSSDMKRFDPMPLEPASNEYYLPPKPTKQRLSYFSSDPNNGSTFPQERLKPEDLLPRDAANTKWAQANPAGQGDVNDVNLLNAGFHLGVNTQGQSLRNASHDLRSEPSNPRYKVSIWNNSTIEPDLNRKTLE